VNPFRHDVLKELTDQQVRFAPAVVRLEQLRRAEKLLAEIDGFREYPYEFVCFRITDYRPTTQAGLLIQGDDLAQDLGLFINQVARSIPALPVEQVDEPVLTLEEFSPS